LDNLDYGSVVLLTLTYMDAIINAGARILIVKLSAMGDVVHTFPVIRAIKKTRPDVFIDWVVGDAYLELAQLSPYADGLIPFKRKEWGRFWNPSAIAQISRFIGKLREREYAAVLDLQGLLRSGAITGVARSKHKIGFAYAREGAPLFYNRKIAAPTGETHAIDRYMKSLEYLGVDSGAGIGYDIAIPQKDIEWAETVLPKEPFVAVNPNARWETKRWPIKKFAELIREIEKKKGVRAVITGGRDEVAASQILASLAGGGVVNLAGTGGFGRLAAILQKADCLFTNDSGPMHLAVALGTPVVAVFGPTNPKLTGPYGGNSAAVTPAVDCAPCFKRSCGIGMECMNSISVDDVMNAWEKVLTRGGAANG